MIRLDDRDLAIKSESRPGSARAPLAAPSTITEPGTSPARPYGPSHHAHCAHGDDRVNLLAGVLLQASSTGWPWVT